MSRRVKVAATAGLIVTGLLLSLLVMVLSDVPLVAQGTHDDSGNTVRVITPYDATQDHRIDELIATVRAQAEARAQVNWPALLTLAIFLSGQLGLFLWKFSALTSDVRQNRDALISLQADVRAINTSGPMRPSPEAAAGIAEIKAQIRTLHAERTAQISRMEDDLCARIDAVDHELKSGLASALDRIDLLEKHVISCPVPPSARDPFPARDPGSRTRSTDRERR